MVQLFWGVTCLLDGEGPAGDLDNGRAGAEVAREEVGVEGGGHQDHAQVCQEGVKVNCSISLSCSCSCTGFLAWPLPEDAPEDHEEEVAVLAALVHLVHHDVRHERQLRVVLQPPQEDARRAEEESCRRRRLHLQSGG